MNLRETTNFKSYENNGVGLKIVTALTRVQALPDGAYTVAEDLWSNESDEVGVLTFANLHYDGIITDLSQRSPIDEYAKTSSNSLMRASLLSSRIEYVYNTVKQYYNIY